MSLILPGAAGLPAPRRWPPQPSLPFQAQSQASALAVVGVSRCTDPPMACATSTPLSPYRTRSKAGSRRISPLRPAASSCCDLWGLLTVPAGVPGLAQAGQGLGRQCLPRGETRAHRAVFPRPPNIPARSSRCLVDGVTEKLFACSGINHVPAPSTLVSGPLGPFIQHSPNLHRSPPCSRLSLSPPPP